MKRLSISIPVISLAKEEEEVFIPGRPSPLPIQRTSPASLLLQQLRNETHWAALKRHRKKRDKAFLSDQILADVKGIGPKRKKRLLDHFGSLENLLEANQTELESLLGSRVAASIYKQLHR